MATLRKILLVDDDDDLREALSEQLVMTEDFDVFEASTGLEGMEKAKASAYDLVILDVGLPDTDGRGAELLVQELQQLVRRQALEHAASPLGRVSFSAGVAVVDLAREGVTAEALVAAADRALYQAKQQGRDGYCVAGSVAAGQGC